MAVDPSVFIIEEDIPDASRLKIELRDTDIPYGFPRQVVAFETGGEVAIAENGIYNPGSDRVVLQVMQPKERPLTVKGRFRDATYFTAQRPSKDAPLPAHARAMRDKLESIRRRCNPVKITWAGETRIGLLWETKFGEESANDIQYELKFFIALSHNNANQENVNFAPLGANSTDLLLQMQASLADTRAKQLACAFTAIAAAGVSNGWTSLDSAMTNAAQAASMMEATAITETRTNINRVKSATASVKSAAGDLKAVIDSQVPEIVLVTQDSKSLTQWWDATFSTQLQLDQIVDTMRQMQLRAVEMMNAGTRLYRVRPGDTLESIAQQQLGSRARAGDLNVRQDQLVLGKYIRIPQG